MIIQSNDEEILQQEFKNTSEVPRGKNLVYLCMKCGDRVPSVPKDNIGCTCGNIYIDRDYVRLVVEDFTNFCVISITINANKERSKRKL
jgi:hypothetical protein